MGLSGAYDRAASGPNAPGQPIVPHHCDNRPVEPRRPSQAAPLLARPTPTCIVAAPLFQYGPLTFGLSRTPRVLRWVCTTPSLPPQRSSVRTAASLAPVCGPSLACPSTRTARLHTVAHVLRDAPVHNLPLHVTAHYQTRLRLRLSPDAHSSTGRLAARYAAPPSRRLPSRSAAASYLWRPRTPIDRRTYRRTPRSHTSFPGYPGKGGDGLGRLARGTAKRARAGRPRAGVRGACGALRGGRLWRGFGNVGVAASFFACTEPVARSRLAGLRAARGVVK